MLELVIRGRAERPAGISRGWVAQASYHTPDDPAAADSEAQQSLWTAGLAAPGPTPTSSAAEIGRTADASALQRQRPQAHATVG